jgi:general secretion pathway protein G
MVIGMRARTPAPSRPPRPLRGFTLIELIVVMAIVAMLIALSLPRYVRSIERSREAVLRHDLRAMREAIDLFMGDRDRYPASLDELVEQRYLRSVPVDPYTDSATSWLLVAPPEPDVNGLADGVYDVRSAATGQAADGTPFNRW